ncbi:MAG: HIT domain-containing protein [Phycisphaerales bacterium]|nr:HIT domain-containing protein [Phycisphaerales bacterium]
MHDPLWAPWRMAYLQRLSDDDIASRGGLDDFIASAFTDPQADEVNHVVHRTPEGIILLNRYPYANGHLLVALGEARAKLLDYDPAQRQAFWGLVDTAMHLMHRVLQPQGVNMGINEGEAAGAGLPGHLHAHLVPRWHGDANFMAAVAGARVIPSTLDDMAAAYRAPSA